MSDVWANPEHLFHLLQWACAGSDMMKRLGQENFHRMMQTRKGRELRDLYSRGKQNC